MFDTSAGGPTFSSDKMLLKLRVLHIALSLTVIVICEAYDRSSRKLLKLLDSLNEVDSWNQWNLLTEKLLYRQLINNGIPTCTAPYYTGTIQSNATAGTFITRVTATDPNGGNLTFTIPDTSLQRFTINPLTGDIFTSANLTRAAVLRSVLEFLVRATNAAGQSCDSLVRVNILTTPVSQTIITVYNQTNTGAAAPTFSQTAYTCSTGSCNTGNTICTLSASGATSYSVLNTNNINMPYAINSNGVVSFSGTGTVNSGSNTSFTVQATNANGNSATTTVYIASSCSYFPGGSGSGGNFVLPGGGIGSIGSAIGLPGSIGSFYQGNPATVASVVTLAPVFSQSVYTFNAPGCSAGSTVGGMQASNNPSNFVINGNNNFAISNTGVISLNYASTAGTQSFMVGASNSAGSAVVPVTVTLTCTGAGGVPGAVGSQTGSTGPGAPSFSQSAYSISISNCGVGSVVGALSVSNANTFAILSNGGTPPGYGINYKGVITLTETPTPGATQTILVEAFNGLGAAFASVSITANCIGSFPYPVGTNLPPTSNGGPVPGPPAPMPQPGPSGFPQTAYSFSLSSCNPGSSVGSVSAGGGATYAITGGGAGFAINPSSGQIMITGPVNPGNQAFLVQATTPGGNSFATVTVNANCNGGGGGGDFQGPSPQQMPSGGGGAAGASYQFSSICQPGASVGSVSAGGAQSTYTIASGGSGFSINSQTGTITATSSSSGTQTFFVQAMNSGGSALASVTVTCTGGGGGGGNNNYGGAFSQPSYTFYPTACGPNVIVGTVYARGTNVQYSSNGLPYWSIDPATGVISSVTSVPNFSTFVVTAQTSAGTATVTVTTTSACPDYFAYTVTTCSPNAVVVPASAISGIAGGGMASFALSGPQSSLFSLDPKSGQITSTGQLTSGTYAYVLTAAMAQGGSYTAFVTLIVSCGGASVSFSQPVYSFTIGCSNLPQRVGVVLAQASNGESMNYSLGAVNNSFYVDPTSGEVRTQQALRRAGKHYFTVSALGASGATGTATVNVSVAGCR